MTLFSAPNYCGEFDNAGAMMSVDETLLCSFQVCCWLLQANKFDSRTLLFLSFLPPCPVDLETCGEKTQVPVWRNEHGEACDTTS